MVWGSGRMNRLLYLAQHCGPPGWTPEEARGFECVESGSQAQALTCQSPPCLPSPWLMHALACLLWPIPYNSALSLHRTKVSPPIDAQKGHPLLDMQLGSWVIPCLLFGGLVRGSSGGSGWLILYFFLWRRKHVPLIQFFL